MKTFSDNHGKSASVQFGITLLFLSLLIAIAVLPRFAGAQSSSQAPAQNPQQNQEPPEPTIRLEIKEVQIPFSVFDKKGILALDLKREDFRVFEDGVEQKIEFFSAPANLPLRFGILIDTSS